MMNLYRVKATRYDLMVILKEEGLCGDKRGFEVTRQAGRSGVAFVA